jgi:endonuclease YncB( thermonuclease family)
MKQLLILGAIMLSNLTYAGDVYFAKVSRVDDHNVMHLISEGKIRAVNLGYLSTPVKGEVFHKEVNTYLKSLVENKWVRITELSYGQKATVKPVLVRLRNLKTVNMNLVKEGYALPNLATNPPKAIITAAKKAKDENKGIWPAVQQFSAQRMGKSKDRIGLLMSGFVESLRKVKEKGIEPVVGDTRTKIAYKFACLMKIKNRRMFSTQYAAKNNGYTLNNDSCPDSS